MLTVSVHVYAQILLLMHLTLTCPTTKVDFAWVCYQSSLFFIGVNLPCNTLGSVYVSSVSSVILSLLCALPLQDPENKKIIVCDEKLKAIFGGRDRVGFLEISGLINPHFSKWLCHTQEGRFWCIDNCRLMTSFLLDHARCEVFFVW